MSDWKQDGQEKHTEAQRRMLNAVCGDLAKQINWHGCRFDKDDWRHFLSGIAAGWRMVPGYDMGDGVRGMVMLGASSLRLTKSQAKDAITMGLSIGDAPDEQGLACKPVKWSPAVLMGLGFNPNDFEVEG